MIYTYTNTHPVRLKKHPIIANAKSDKVKKTIMEDGSASFGRCFIDAQLSNTVPAAVADIDDSTMEIVGM